MFIDVLSWGWLFFNFQWIAVGADYYQSWWVEYWEVASQGPDMEEHGTITQPQSYYAMKIFDI